MSNSKSPMGQSARIYRPLEPSDLSKAQSGKLQTYYKDGERYLPAKLISTRLSSAGTLWLLNNGNYDMYSTSNRDIMVDITPEKRYAIWSKRNERFIAGEQFKNGNCFRSRDEAMEANHQALKRYFKDLDSTLKAQDGYVIIEFDYPGAESA
jgi:hypothetical protein